MDVPSAREITSESDGAPASCHGYVDINKMLVEKYLTVLVNSCIEHKFALNSSNMGRNEASVIYDVIC